jgi:hypothetical protein
MKTLRKIAVKYSPLEITEGTSVHATFSPRSTHFFLIKFLASLSGEALFGCLLFKGNLFSSVL